MTLPAGTRLGPYEVLSPLGAGGMGEVYRARDSRLSREVAIKVLPAAVALDPERLKRFEKESRSASALNHPSIVTIYDIGSSEGVSWIAMELVEGATLRELLAGGPLPVRRFLQIAPQIAEALAKAHEAGIVHRDLKPENVMVTKDGLVKVLDFGLAKLTSTMSGSGEGSNLPTMTETTPGVVVGTVGYMSPEQANAQAVDYRSDQFSLGSILYEMATGKKAFQRKTAVDTLAAILNEEPNPIAATNPQVPAPLRWIVERCHAKEPEGRYASTKDLTRDLATVRDHISEVSSIHSTALRPARRRIPVLGALLALALAAIPAAHFVGRRSGQYHAPSFELLTFRRGSVLHTRYTPDGGSIVYGASWEGAPTEIFTARLDGTESRPLGVKNADVLAVSSKGEVAILLKKRNLRNVGGTGTLAVMPLAGGAQRELLEDVAQADWSPDGAQLAVVRHDNDESRLEYPIGRLLYKSTDAIGYMRVSGSGKQVAFREGRELRIVDDAGRVTTLTHVRDSQSLHGLLWRAGDREIVFGVCSSGVKGDVCDLDVVDLGGHVRTVYRGTDFFFPQDLLADGRLLITQLKYSVDLIVGSSKESSEKSLGWLRKSWITDMSEDGRTVLFTDNIDIYLRQTDGSPAVRLGAGGLTTCAGLSPDGKWILTGTPPEHEMSLIPTGPGRVRKISIGELVLVGGCGVTPDGRSIFFSATASDGQERVYITEATGGAPRAVSKAGSLASWTVSPDGKEIAVNDATTSLKIYPIEGGPPRAVAGLDPEDVLLAWEADARFLYVARIRDVPTHIERFDLTTGRKEPWKTLLPPDATGAYYIGPVKVTRNGLFWAYSVNRASSSELWQVTGLEMR